MSKNSIFASYKAASVFNCMSIIVQAAAEQLHDTLGHDTRSTCPISVLSCHSAEAVVSAGEFTVSHMVAKLPQLTESTALCIAAMVACLSPCMRRNART